MVKVWNERLKDILIRAFKTFIQGFLAALIVLLKDTDLEDFSMLKTILIGALAGGISAVMNLIIKALEPPEDTEASGDSYE
ncbi:MAG: hypothetical protein IKN65_00135 [Clostridia bacterium]|nr:hypothetical protein [Bacilli bacterium]MBR3672691.1 hypothetical protein [Clostridia bacterium]MBR4671565.1 hypothetical protein [Bacilli bacterium]